MQIAGTPTAVAKCVLPVPGPPMSTTLWACSIEVAAAQRLDEYHVDRVLHELKTREIAVGREARGLQLILDRAAHRHESQRHAMAPESLVHLVKMLYFGQGLDEAVVANPTSEFDAKLGDPMSSRIARSEARGRT